MHSNGIPDEKKWLKRRKWKDRTKAEKNNGDKNKGDAHSFAPFSNLKFFVEVIYLVLKYS